MKPTIIKLITDKVKNNCLIGRKAFEKEVQQFTCKRYNGNNCECHANYIQALKKHKLKTIKQ